MFLGCRHIVIINDTKYKAKTECLDNICSDIILDLDFQSQH